MNTIMLTIADKTFRSRLIVGTGKYPSHSVMAAGASRLGHGDGDGRRSAREPGRPQRRVAAQLHRPVEDLHSPEYRRVLHRRGRGAHRAAGARGRALELGEARGHRRRADALPRQRRAARGDAHARSRGLRRPSLHERRSQSSAASSRRLAPRPSCRSARQSDRASASRTRTTSRSSASRRASRSSSTPASARLLTRPSRWSSARTAC